MPAKKHARQESASEDKPATKHACQEKTIEQDPALRRPSVRRAKAIDADPPFAQLDALVQSNKSASKPKNVLHWFRSKDIRAEDNKALHAASQKAKEGSGSLLTLYIHSPKDLEWHGTSPVRTDFLLEGLRLLQEQLQNKHIPFAIVTAEERKVKTQRVLDFVKEHDITHIYANYEYEVDELRRDIDLFKHKDANLSFELFHDQTIIVPGQLRTGGGGPHKVFTPYHKAWLAETKTHPHLFDPLPSPSPNDPSASKTFAALFSTPIPALPESKQFPTEQDRTRLRSLWPAGHAAALARLQTFLATKVATYADTRTLPAANATSRLSPYFASGQISLRETLALARSANGDKHFDASGADKGIAAWVRELVFREFYRHVMVFTPHGSMNLPQNLKFDNVEWETDEVGWSKWCSGTTGVPFVDAGMRQLNSEGWMHNRLRMNVSSYLSANLLIDYRRGERYFAEKLVDWDLCNNTQGWEPGYTVFNPVSQGDKCDPVGTYVRRWVEELRGVKGKAVFDPAGRLRREEFEGLGYPRPHVEYRETSARAKERYKVGIAGAEK